MTSRELLIKIDELKQIKSDLYNVYYMQSECVTDYTSKSDMKKIIIGLCLVYAKKIPSCIIDVKCHKELFDDIVIYMNNHLHGVNIFIIHRKLFMYHKGYKYTKNSYRRIIDHHLKKRIEKDIDKMYLDFLDLPCDKITKDTIFIRLRNKKTGLLSGTQFILCSCGSGHQLIDEIILPSVNDIIKYLYEDYLFILERCNFA